jgi:hypothetical protein
MEFRYMGFDQKGNARVYRFDCLAKGEPSRHFTVTADMGLFLTHHVAIQEGPGLCAIKLAADLEKSSDDVHELTGEDLGAHALTVSMAAARKAESRKNTPRRAPEATAYEASPWRTSRTV